MYPLYIFKPDYLDPGESPGTVQSTPHYEFFTNFFFLPAEILVLAVTRKVKLKVTEMILKGY